MLQSRQSTPSRRADPSSRCADAPRRPARRASDRSTRPACCRASRRCTRAPRVDARGSSLGAARRARRASRARANGSRVVERPARLSRLEHRAEERERDVARERRRRARRTCFVAARASCQKRAQLDLANVDANAAQRRDRPAQLLERVVAAADGEQVELERLAVARCAGAARRSVASRRHRGASRRRAVSRSGRPRAARADSPAGPVRRRAFRIRRAPRCDDSLAVDRQRDRATHADIVERRLVNVEDEARREENRIVDDAHRRIAPSQRRPSSGEMPATSSSPLARPANFVVGSSTTRDDQPGDARRSAECRWKMLVASERPASTRRDVRRTRTARCPPARS